MKPLERGQGFVFLNEIKGGAIPQEFINPTEKGVKESLDKGIVAGYPVIDVEVTLYDGSFHEVDSSKRRSRSRAPWRSRKLRSVQSRSFWNRS